MAHDVFICYSSKDKTTADAVCAVLESEGIRCWIAPRDILAGMSYGEAIVNAIHSAKALVLVFSGHANASPQIEREVERAINQRIPVIPLRIEDVAPDKALEYFLSTPHWLDAFTPPLERHLKNLAAQINRLIVTGSKADAQAAKDAAAVVSAGSSPFKTIQTPEPPPDMPPKPEPVPEPKPATMAAAIGADAASTASIVPPTTTAPRATSPVAFFNKLDTSAKVGIGAAALVLVIGVGWLLSSAGSGPTSVVVTPQNGVTINDGKDSVHVGPDGSVQIGEPTPGTPATPPPQAPTGNAPSTPGLPSDGDVVPGRDGSQAAAPSGVYDAVSGADVASALTEAGFDAQIGKDSQGDPMITGAIQGYKYSIFFYRCRKSEDPERCFDLQFHAAFTNDINVGNEQLNAYNRDNRFGQAYLMQNGDIGLDMSATIQGGVARQHLKDVMRWWKVTLTAFPQKLTGG
jgi:TIR domain/Putative bacterial sensory transduction regulator